MQVDWATDLYRRTRANVDTWMGVGNRVSDRRVVVGRCRTCRSPVSCRMFAWTAALAVVASVAVERASAQDIVEFLTGARLEGRVTAIDKQARTVTFEALIGQRKVSRTYPYSKVHAVTYRGKRYVLTRKSSTGAATPKGAAAGTQRSEAEIISLIKAAGQTPPDWWDSTPLQYPRTLDLSWPLKAPAPWNNQKNIGQYLWDVIYPNTDRWKSGFRLVHHTMSLHQSDSARLGRDMRTLGSMYFNLLQDYARAAFWWRKARITKDDLQGVLLGECYWRLGNKRMALNMLTSRRLHLAAIKVYGDMGELREALEYANDYVRAGGRSQEAYLLAGDACRKAGRYDQAISYYQKVLDAQDARNKDYDRRYDERAKESIAAVQIADLADVKKTRDGAYKASGFGYNGPIEVEVTVADHQIKSVKVLRHREKQYYSALTDTPNQIIKKQSVQGIDTTSRATITSVAIINATAKALAAGAQAH